MIALKMPVATQAITELSEQALFENQLSKAGPITTIHHLIAFSLLIQGCVELFA